MLLAKDYAYYIMRFYAYPITAYPANLGNCLHIANLSHECVTHVLFVTIYLALEVYSQWRRKQIQSGVVIPHGNFFSFSFKRPGSSVLHLSRQIESGEAISSIWRWLPTCVQSTHFQGGWGHAPQTILLL